MEKIAELLKIINQPMEQSFNIEQYLTDRAERFNATTGELTGYDCKKCKNRGYFAVEVDGYEVMRECECLGIRRSLRNIKKSGIEQLMQEYTFDTYRTMEKWQEDTKKAAIKFIQDNFGKWFFVGGQVGSGKTHICTAIVGKLLKLGKEAKYMTWRDEITPLKANINEPYYAKEIDYLKTVEVLYIDDFFKTEQGKTPTTADINIAFELLNYRYNNKNLITIISSEKSIDELMSIDEAIGSRIYQRTKDCCFVIGADRDKNMRLHNEIF